MSAGFCQRLRLFLSSSTLRQICQPLLTALLTPSNRSSSSTFLASGSCTIRNRPYFVLIFHLLVKLSHEMFSPARLPKTSSGVSSWKSWAAERWTPWLTACSLTGCFPPRWRVVVMWIRVSVQADLSTVLHGLRAAGRRRSLDRPLATSAIFEVNGVNVFFHCWVFKVIRHVCLSFQPVFHFNSLHVLCLSLLPQNWNLSNTHKTCWMEDKRDNELLNVKRTGTLVVKREKPFSFLFSIF